VQRGHGAVRHQHRRGLLAEQELHLAVHAGLEPRPLAERVAEGVELGGRHPGDRPPRGAEAVHVQLAAAQGAHGRAQVVGPQLPLRLPPLEHQQAEVQLHDLGDDQERHLARVVGGLLLQRVQDRGVHVVLVRRRAAEVEFGALFAVDDRASAHVVIMRGRVAFLNARRCLVAWKVLMVESRFGR
jgi:hypothetical protein